MKKIKNLIIVIAIVLFSNYSLGQTEKGKVLIAGNSTISSNYSTSKSEITNFPSQESKGLSFNLSPTVGYFFINNLAGGLSLSTSFAKQKRDDIESTFSSLSVAPFLRYYFTTNKIKPFVQAQVGFGNSKNNFGPSYDTEFKSNLFTIGAIGGVAIFVNNSIAFDLGIGYNRSTRKPKNTESSSSKNINSLIGLNVGVSITL